MEESEIFHRLAERGVNLPQDIEDIVVYVLVRPICSTLDRNVRGDGAYYSMYVRHIDARLDDMKLPR